MRVEPAIQLPPQSSKKQWQSLDNFMRPLPLIVYMWIYYYYYYPPRSSPDYWYVFYAAVMLFLAVVVLPPSSVQVKTISPDPGTLKLKAT